VEDRTPLIFFVGEAPSPDDNPGMVTQDGVEPPLTLCIRQPRYRCATGPSYELAGGLGFEPSLCLVNKQIPYQLGEPPRSGAMYGNRTRLDLIDNQVPRQSAYIAWSSHLDSNQNLSLRRAAPCPLDDGPQTGTPATIRTPIPRFVALCPVHWTTGVRKLWLAAQASNLEPPRSERGALPIAPAASGCGPRN
jgi:hypothetical protein